MTRPTGHHLRRHPVVGVACVVVLAVACGPSSSTPATALRTEPDAQSSRAIASVERIDDLLASAVSRQDVLGVVAIAVDRDGVIYRGAFGTADESADLLMDTDAVFRIASMTKPVTSVAAMQLVEQGAIALDEAAAVYLPALAQTQVLEQFDPQRGTYELRPPASPITVRQLLTHTAGFGYPFTSDTLRDFEPQAGDGDVVGPLLFDPGTSWWYGTNTDWVGRLVESVSGQSLEAYFREHIFAPLQMSDTVFNVPEADWPRTVALASRQRDGGLLQEARQDPTRVTTFSGGGGLWSTANDYARFMRMWLNGGALDGQRVLSAETVATMSANQVGSLPAGTIVTALPERSNDFRPTADGRGRFGLGFLINLDDQPGGRAGGSLAWAGLYNTYFWIDPASGVAGVILTQVLPFADPRVLGVFDAFERAVYALVAEVV
jgi:CubicO group peptidase (beta-lactamase class C family)